MKKSKDTKSFFADELLNWHHSVNSREMPWKGEKDPYKIWLSEIILQQTRVTQGLPYYLKFIKTYPTVALLAGATDSDVFKLWEGLGYYSRCRNLLTGARQIMGLYDGIFPDDYKLILAIKGVGPYTAAAIASFAFGLPYAVVDGNVIRVLARYFGIYTPFDTTEGKKDFAGLAQQLIIPEHASNYNQAIMDFGASICTPAAPLCEACPLQKHCVAFKAKTVKDLPVRLKKLVKKKRWFLYFVIKTCNKILIRQRHSKDIWQNLHEFFLVENEAALEWNSSESMEALEEFKGAKLSLGKQSAIYTQQLTHQTIFARFFEINAAKLLEAPTGYIWVSIEEMDKLAFPKIINAFLSATNAPALLF
ncbi:A/G-specific adenine glycosylase [soil metagenome]